jgi:phenylacetate-coenzyme A ligase PaaK-like adenylate-forming protein
VLIVREYFVAKPGHATKLANLIKNTIVPAWQGKTRVLTDMTGEFNRVVLETEVGSLAEFEERMKEYQSNPEWRTKMAGYTDLWTTGGREIFRVV